MVSSTDPPRYHITLVLEPIGAHDHADARLAARRVAEQVEALTYSLPPEPARRLVEVKSLHIGRSRDN
jgi:hypothetical protein